MTKESADKRSVATDALRTLGTVIGDGEKRDAIHLAVEPAIAAHRLPPGAHVGFIGQEVGVCDDPVGIVDPFLERFVQKGERFWLVVYPRQITSLRHVWEHPKFPNSERREEPLGGLTNAVLHPSIPSKKWLEDYARQIGSDYYELMLRAEDWEKNEDYWNEGERFNGTYLPDEFWDHWENVTSRKATRKGSFFSCGC